MRYLILAATIFLSACASPGGYYAPVYDPVAIQMINNGMQMMDVGRSPQYFPHHTSCHNTGRFTNCFSH